MVKNHTEELCNILYVQYNYSIYEHIVLNFTSYMVHNIYYF